MRRLYRLLVVSLFAAVPASGIAVTTDAAFGEAPAPSGDTLASADQIPGRNKIKPADPGECIYIQIGGVWYAFCY